MSPVVLAELLLVLWVGAERTIDDLLLGEVHWVFTGLDSDGAFESSQGSEGPTGAAASLVLNIHHLAIVSPIDSGGSVGLSKHTRTSGIVASTESSAAAIGMGGFAHFEAGDGVGFRIG